MSLDRSDQLDDQIKRDIEERKKNIQAANEERQRQTREEQEEKKRSQLLIEQHNAMVRRQQVASGLEDETHRKLRDKLILLSKQIASIESSNTSMTFSKRVKDLQVEYDATLQAYNNTPINLGKLRVIAKPVLIFVDGPAMINLLPQQDGSSYVACEGPYASRGLGDWKVVYDKTTKCPIKLTKDVLDNSGVLDPPSTLHVELDIVILDKEEPKQPKKPKIAEPKPKPVEYEEHIEWARDPLTGKEVQRVVREEKTD
ncbi:MAG: hypothetical protein WCD81_05575 [Candidatus Bathyarchaeia archaeon]